MLLWVRACSATAGKGRAGATKHKISAESA